ncbi:hypothetical protein [Bacillus sp. YC2]|uniref:hypothetical protein n=1 Tax=Bacillus sp. YC2 TaxID=2861287 RepID=UPI0037C14B24
MFNAFVRILNKTGLEKLPIHALRDTHAVLLLESGTSMKYVQERLAIKVFNCRQIFTHTSAKKLTERFNE